VRELREGAKGKKFWSVDVKNAKLLMPSADVFADLLKGVRVLDVVRRGKFIVFVLSNHMRLVIHLRMTGRVMWHVEKGRDKYVVVTFTFSDATKLYFSDVRKFGRVWLYTEKEFEKVTGIHRLGPEPMELSKSDFVEIFYKRKGMLKNLLLRQDLITGVGNIYADEIAFRTGLHPQARMEKLSKTQIGKLFESVQYCLGEGIRHCGVSVSDFVGTKGNLGQHQHYLQVYGRKGLPCYRCKTAIVKTVAAGRGTFYCHICQSIN
jgi:formamidopyrimidine-DNA glycosylase